MPAIGTSIFLLQGPGLNLPRFPNIQPSCYFAQSSGRVSPSQCHNLSTFPEIYLFPCYKATGNTSTAHRHQAGAAPEAGHRQLRLCVSGRRSLARPFTAGSFGHGHNLLLEASLGWKTAECSWKTSCHRHQLLLRCQLDQTGWKQSG